MLNKFPFHKVEKSPWPIFCSFSLLGLLFSSVLYFHSLISSGFFFFFLFVLVLKTYFWWSNVISESNFGFHKSFVVKNFLIGMMMMIMSEVFFFVSFFWGFFHKCFFPGEGMGKVWPPIGFENSLVVDYLSIPLFNTIILLSSGVTITWSHHSLICGNYTGFFKGLVSTVLLGILFLFLQNFEYLKSFLSFKTLIFGSCFYILTGFHGLHVVVGTIFLMVCLIRVKNFQFNPSHHVGLTLAIWYWHFVDVVWLFLFIFVYWYTAL